MSGDEVADDLAVDVGEAVVAAGVAVGEGLVVEAEEGHHGSVEVVDVDGFIDGFEAEVVGGAVGCSGFDAAAGEPHGEAVVVVVAAVDFAGIGTGLGEFDDWGAAEFAAPDDEGFVEHAALFEVFEESADGLVGFGGEAAVIDFEVVVIVPWLAFAVPELDEADPAFDEPAGDERLAAVDIVAVEVADVLGFAVEVEGVAGVELHAVGEFEGLDASFEAGVAGAAGLVFAVHFVKEVELDALFAHGEVFVADVFDEFVEVAVLGVYVGALEDAGEEAGLPVLAFLDGVSAWAHDDEAGEVLIEGAEAVGDP